jgi:hypothetical protein
MQLLFGFETVHPSLQLCGQFDFISTLARINFNEKQNDHLTRVGWVGV